VYAYPTSDNPIIDFSSIAGRDVFAFCSGLLAGSNIVLVNKTSGGNAGQMAASNGPVTFSPVRLSACR